MAESIFTSINLSNHSSELKDFRIISPHTAKTLDSNDEQKSKLIVNKTFKTEISPLKNKSSTLRLNINLNNNSSEISSETKSQFYNNYHNNMKSIFHQKAY